MKSYKRLIKEQRQQALGNCFESAAKIVFDAIKQKDMPIPGTDPSDWTLVHALVYGQGSLSGRRFAHAWKEFKKTIVFDQSNGNDINMLAPSYYRIGKVNPNERGAFVRYSLDEAKKKLFKEGHFGPWDLDETLLEGLFSDKSATKIKLDAASKELLRKA